MHPAALVWVRPLIILTGPQRDWLRTQAFERRTSITGKIRELVRDTIDRDTPPATQTRGKERR